MTYFTKFGLTCFKYAFLCSPTCSYEVKTFPIYICIEDSFTNSQVTSISLQILISIFQLHLLKAVLQIRVFQLAGNYMVELEASESHERYVENQLEV